MQLKLDNVDFADGDELAAVQAAADADNALVQALHPGLSLDEAVAAAKERWASVYGFSSWCYKKVVDADTGKIVAYARWGVDEEYRKDLPPVTGMLSIHHPLPTSSIFEYTLTDGYVGIPEGMAIPPRQKPASLNFELAGQIGQQSEPIAEKALHGRPSLCKTPFARRFSIFPFAPFSSIPFSFSLRHASHSTNPNSLQSLISLASFLSTASTVPPSCCLRGL